jgi:hypothetical protein
VDFAWGVIAFLQNAVVGPQFCCYAVTDYDVFLVAHVEATRRKAVADG